ncbi:MAG: glycosyltransferase [Infirmifilum sp.]
MNKDILVIYGISYFGNSGDSVNERQLINELCKVLYVKNRITCIVFTNILLKNLIKLDVLKRQLLEKPPNLIIVPIYAPNIFLSSFIGLFLSLILYLYVIFSRHKVYIYTRNSWNALGFIYFPRLRHRLIVKIGALIEDEIQPGKLKRLFIEASDRHILTKSQWIAVPSPLLLRELALRRGRVTKAIFIPPGIDLKKILKIKCDKVKKDHYIIGFVGSLFWWQGVDLLVKAAMILTKLKLDKPIRLIIVGDGPERRKIEQLCRYLGKKCEITGFVSHEKALQILSCFDVLVLPSRRTSATNSNVPIKVLEAWALGIPVITAPHEIYQFLGIENEKGIIFCKLDPNDIAMKIVNLFMNWKVFGGVSNGIRHLVYRFCYCNIASRIAEILLEN